MLSCILRSGFRLSNISTMNVEPAAMKAVASASWAGRVEEALGGHFKPQMTRAVILLAIYEANRM